jgi:DNA sulfur modification protein DndD
VRIDYIQMTNFRQYRDVRLTFPSSADVTVIVAKNGTGKTNLLNAITWCLYGEEAFSSAQEGGKNQPTPKKRMPMLYAGNKDNPLKPGSAECTVEIGFREEDGTVAVVGRVQRFDVVAADQVTATGVSLFSVMRKKGGGGYTELEDPDHWVTRNLPKHIRPYYILNTERLNQFFHQGAEATRVRNAILEIAKIDTLVEMKRRLSLVRDGLYSSSGGRGAGDILDSLIKDREDEAARVNDLTSKLADLTQQRDELDAAIESLDSRMVNVHAATEIIVQRRERDERKRALEEDIRDTEDELYRAAVGVLPAALLSGAVAGLSAKIDEAWKAGRIPAPIHPAFLRDTLARRVCICDRSLGDETPEQAAITELLKRHEHASDLGNLLLAQQGPAAVLLRMPADARAKYEALAVRLRGLEDEHKNVSRDLESLKKRAAELGIEDDVFEVLRTEWNKANEARDRCTGDIERTKSQLANADGELEQTTKTLDKELRKRADQQERARLLEFADNCVSALGEAYSQLITETREHVSRALNESFNSMNWKRDAFHGASIDEDYQVHVESAQGFDAGAALGGGEDVCLALSFSQALGGVSDFDVPLILDSPLVKLDPESKVLAVSTMARNLNNRQLLLLMKPDEFAVDVEAALRRECPSTRIVRLKYSDADYSTKEEVA